MRDADFPVAELPGDGEPAGSSVPLELRINSVHQDQVSANQIATSSTL